MEHLGIARNDMAYMPSAREFIAARDFLLSSKSYEEARAGFEWPTSNFNWALDYFDNLAEKCTNPALKYVDDTGVEREVSFRAMREQSNRVANLLKSLELRKGDRILVMLPSRIELFETILGAMKVGCVIIPASTLLTSEDVKDRMIRGRIQCVIVDEQLVPTADVAISSSASQVTKINLGQEIKGWLPFSEANAQAAIFKSDEEFSLQDELLIYFTSGTTAKPKLVLHTYGSYPIGHLSTMYWIGFKPGDIHYNISAPGWAKYAWSSIFGVWNAEATSFVYNYSGKFNPKEVLRIISQHKVNTLCAPPTVWRFLLLENLKKYKFDLKQIVSAGEPLNPEIIQKVKDATGLAIREGFGQTETTLQVGTFPGMQVKPGSMGVEAPGYEISILSDEHIPTPAKTEGMVAIRVKPKRPIGLMQGYIDPPEKNLEVFIGDWYLTGDVAFKDENGYFWFIGRSDDVFKSSDYRISAFELESELMAHPLVTEVAVVASPDKLRGFVPKAIITLRPDTQPSKELALEIFRFTRERMAPYKRPRIIQFTLELPKTVSGKIRRNELRRAESDLRSKNKRSQEEYFESDFPELKSERRGATQ